MLGSIPAVSIFKMKNKYNQKYYLRQTQRGWLRKQYLIELKGGGCEKCGYKKCSRCLSFHHRNPDDKLFTLDLRQIGNKNWNVILAEFEKCDLLCMNCHGEVHDEETSKEYLKYEMIRKESHMMICLNCGEEFKICNSSVEKGGGKFCSIKCTQISRRKVDRPNKETLAKLLWEKPTTQIAEEFGVSDKAVGKWAKLYDLNKPPRGYWSKIKGN